MVIFTTLYAEEIHKTRFASHTGSRRPTGYALSALDYLRETKEGVEAELQGLSETALDLHETCDWTLQNFDARQKARSDEMDALKQAIAYLSGAKLLQQ